MKRKRGCIYRIFITFVQLGLIIVLTTSGFGIGYIASVLKKTPKLDVNMILSANQTSTIYDRNEEYIDAVPSEEERYVIEREDIPNDLINAFIAIEDERFLEHNGIDVKRIVGSIIGNAKFLLLKEGGPQGGSTMTQQLLKNTVLYSEASSERSYLDQINRKIKEISLALELEKLLSKDDIITAYLNIIPMGGRIYGVEAASKYYFNKSVSDLNLYECAYLAGLTQAPTTYSAYNTEVEGYPEPYIYRTKTVLMKMRDLGFITSKEHDIAYKEVHENNFNWAKHEVDYKIAYEWYVYPAMAQVKKDLKEKFKYSDDEVNKLLMTGGLKIYTAMDRKMQDSVQSILDDRDNLEVDGSVEEVNDEGVYKLQAAATVIDYKKGEVVAIVGGRGEQPPMSLNRAYGDLKPIASTTKPLTVYGAAIDSNTITAGSPIDDSPIPSSITSKYASGYWNPQNYNFALDGYITAREAIAFSKNITSIRTVDKMGIEKSLEYGIKAGIVYNSISQNSMSALALGQHDNNPFDRDGGNTTILASAFGSFGNNGVITEPSFYTRVEDSSGNVILERETPITTLFTPQTAYIMYDILKEPVKRFDASGAKFGNIPVSGKTGTTENVDAFWFSGLTPYYSGAVWIGYDEPQSMSGYSTSAANLWGKIMKKVHKGLEYIEIEKPSGIVSKTICIDSGRLASDLCNRDPRGNRVRSELFADNTAPFSSCETHVLVKVNKSNNKLVTENTPKDLIEEKVFIKKENASSSAADYKYVVPKEKDDTKPKVIIKLSQIGLSAGMDLYDAIMILQRNNIKYKINGVSEPTGTGQATLESYPSEVEEGKSIVISGSKTIVNVPVAPPDTDNEENVGDDSENIEEDIPDEEDDEIIGENEEIEN